MRSASLTTPTTAPPLSTTGMDVIECWSSRIRASFTDVFGVTVIGRRVITSCTSMAVLLSGSDEQQLGGPTCVILLPSRTLRRAARRGKGRKSRRRVADGGLRRRATRVPAPIPQPVYDWDGAITAGSWPRRWPGSRPSRRSRDQVCTSPVGRLTDRLGDSCFASGVSLWSDRRIAWYGVSPASLTGAAWTGSSPSGIGTRNQGRAGSPPFRRPGQATTTAGDWRIGRVLAVDLRCPRGSASRFHTHAPLTATGWPGSSPRTPAPTSCTQPAFSCPSVNGGFHGRSRSHQLCRVHGCDTFGRFVRHQYLPNVPQREAAHVCTESSYRFNCCWLRRTPL